MEGVTIENVVAFASNVGGNAILLLIIFAIVRGWLVPKPFVDEVRKDRDEWKQVARGGVVQASETVKAQTRTVSVAEEAAKVVAEVMRVQQEQMRAQGGQGTPAP